MAYYKAMRKRDTQSGQFVTGSEPVVSKPISVRLPPSLEAELRKAAGGAIAPWIREAIAEKLKREKHQKSA